jgi:hypothetical protein
MSEPDFTLEKIRITAYDKNTHSNWPTIVKTLKVGDEFLGRTVLGKCVCDRIMMDETMDGDYPGICSGHTACHWCESCGPTLDEDFDYEMTSESGIGTCKKCAKEIREEE